MAGVPSTAEIKPTKRPHRDDENTFPVDFGASLIQKRPTMDGTLLALVALFVAGLASVLGIWMERDPTRPPRWAIALSVLIVLATIVSLFQTIEDARASAKMEEDMARMLQSLDKMASSSPELSQYLAKEMEAQSRSNPDVINKVAERVSAEGGDPNAMLARHLPAGELRGAAGDGAKVNSAAVQANNQAELKQLEARLAQANEKAKAAETAQQDLQKKVDASAETEKASAEKMKAMEEEIQALQKKVKDAGGTTSGASRWGKG